jgi:hypothetical protein
MPFSKSKQKKRRHCEEAVADEAIQRKFFWIATPLYGSR